MLTAGEKTLCVSFEARMPEAQGAINICLPAVVLNAILRRLISEGDRPKRRSKEARARVRELMGEAKLGAVLQFPPMRLPAKELAALAPGCVLRLPLPQHTVSELRVAGLEFGRAHPVRTGEHRGAQLAGSTDLDDGNDALTNQRIAEMTSVNWKRGMAMDKEMASGDISAAGANIEAGIGLLCDIELDATLQFGTREMPLREVLELGPGDVVELDRHVSEPVDLVVGDRIVARGEVVIVSGNFALRITEVATPQLRLENIRCLF
jgi:flagellar motor switch protein FliN